MGNWRVVEKKINNSLRGKSCSVKSYFHLFETTGAQCGRSIIKFRLNEKIESTRQGNTPNTLV